MGMLGFVILINQTISIYKLLIYDAEQSEIQQIIKPT